MTSLAIESMGAFTSVGADVPTTMASLLMVVQQFSDLGVVGAKGGSVIGAPAMIPKDTTGFDRLAFLGLFALDESITSAPERFRARLPLIVCCAQEGGLDGAPADLLKQILGEAPDQLDATSSHVIARGRAGLGEALAVAGRLLDDGRWPGCHLIAVDSMVGGSALRRLIDDERVIQPGQPDGLVPAEGAVALLLAKPQSARLSAGGIRILGTTFAADSVASPPSGPPHRRLASVVDRALKAGGIAVPELAALVHDGTASRRCLEEIAMCRTLLGIAAVQTFTPAISTGELGAVSGLLSLAAMAFYMTKGEVLGPGLCIFTDDSSFRGAAVLRGRLGARSGQGERGDG